METKRLFRLDLELPDDSLTILHLRACLKAIRRHRAKCRQVVEVDPPQPVIPNNSLTKEINNSL